MLLLVAFPLPFWAAVNRRRAGAGVDVFAAGDDVDVDVDAVALPFPFWAAGDEDNPADVVGGSAGGAFSTGRFADEELLELALVARRRGVFDSSQGQYPPQLPDSQWNSCQGIGLPCQPQIGIKVCYSRQACLRFGYLQPGLRSLAACLSLVRSRGAFVGTARGVSSVQTSALALKL